MKRWSVVAALALVLAFGATAVAQPGAVRVLVNGKELVSDVPAQIVDGRTMIPLRAVSEAMGWKVEWDAATGTASVGDPAKVSVAEYDALAHVAYVVSVGLIKEAAEAKPTYAASRLAEVDQNFRPPVYAFTRLKPPPERVDVHALCSLVLLNSYQMLRTILTAADASIHPDAYSNPLGLVSDLNQRGRELSQVTQACLKQLERLVPHVTTTGPLPEDATKEFLLKMIAIYPEGWPK